MTLLAALLPACGGKDFIPRYFPGSETETNGSIDAPATPLPGGNCTIKFNASLCVVLKRGTMSYGAEGQEKLCVDDLPPIAIQVQGIKATLRGDEFPDIVVSGHGLPVPITINGKGTTDGKDNIGSGAVDSSGNITLENFSFFVAALGKTGKIPNLTLTTGVAEGTDDLPDIHGSPATGNSMTLVGSTVLGSIIPAADKYFLDSTLQITFAGKIDPKLSECGGVGSGLPTTVQVTKITTDTDRRQHEQLIPNGTQMEVATNVLIPDTDADVGPQFEGSSKFRIRNISKQAIPLQIPPIVGSFHIRPINGEMTGSLPSQQSIVVQVTFRPVIKTAPGTVTESLSLGSDYFSLVGVARLQGGVPSIHAMDSSGKISDNTTNTLIFADVPVTPATQQAYFQCTTVSCDGNATPTHCQPCLDVATQSCQLLTIDQNQLPIGEVDKSCLLLRPGAKPFQGINMMGGTMGNSTKTIVIRNTGTKELTITSVAIKDIAKSHSTAQFKVSPSAIYVGKDPSVVGHTAPQKLPIKLAPHSDIAAYIVVSYTPTDLLSTADDVVGNTALDQALLLVRVESSPSQQSTTRIQLRGTTTVHEVPPLEVHFVTTTGDKIRGNDSDFPIKGIISTTENASVAVYTKLSNLAEKSMRITNVDLSGDDMGNFDWLDSSEKINAIQESERCFTSKTPVAIHPNGIDLHPHGNTTDNMPLLGCVNFHRDPKKGDAKQQFETVLSVTAVDLDAKQQPAKRADGSLAESKIKILVTATINPRKGKMVFRLTQTMSILATDPPSMASVASSDEIDALIKAGRAKESDRFVFLGAMILDPFDEMTVENEDGSVLTGQNDDITGVFRAIDTRPSTFTGNDTLFPYTSLLYDGMAPEGKRGIFFDYPQDKMPDNFQSSGLRIYTSALSWPGPLEADPENIPYQISECQQVDPCERGYMLGTGPDDINKHRGVCAFFYASAGSWDSPGMHNQSADYPDGSRDNMCKNRSERQQLNSLKGKYSTNGQLIFANNGLRFWGPTYVHNIANTLDRKPPALDEVFHITFTTDPLVPKAEGAQYDYLPEERLDLSKLDHMVNLTDTSNGGHPVCAKNTQNKVIGDTRYSSWKYFAPLLVQDKEGKIPAGCPDVGNSFAKEGARAYLRGRPVDPVTGVFSVVAVTKFGKDEDLTSVFKDVSLFVVLNGWLCDPEGSEAEGEGAKCFDPKFNERDAMSQISLMKEGQ
ncbi:MAG: hypothetical protein COV45_07770 [Deltaproteobacteria bacterium CG11_big_fil_rev_8_21_14_0_20_47_16]|nr:MAG: hypothetical protein COV45_07770 [Deltaproteobacteria bacterium CG11_big_fil_rev_8_21_14_0_20_47_16]